MEKNVEYGARLYMNNHDSYELAKTRWKNLYDNRGRLDKILFIVYVKHDDPYKYIHSGWIEEREINPAKNICTFVIVPKNTGLSLTESNYKKLLNILCYKIKKKLINDKINNLEKDFAYDV